MSESLPMQERFQAMLLEQYQQVIDENDPLRAIRVKGWNRFLELGLPTQYSEAFRAVRLPRLFAERYPQAAAQQQTIHASKLLKDAAGSLYENDRRATLVFVNGRYQPHLSKREHLPESIVIAPLSQAITTYGIFLHHRWEKAMKDELDPFAVVNTVLHRDGIFLYIPPKTIVETPIEIVHIVDINQDNDADSTSFLLTPRLHICVGAFSEVKLRTSLRTHPHSHYCLNKVCDIIIEEGAHLCYEQISRGEADHAWHFDALRVVQKKHSSFQSIYETDGAGMMRYDYRVALMGENAETSLKGIWRLSDRKEAHTHVLVDHQALSCRSTQLFKGVLDDQSRSSFEGKILVRPEAQKTDAFQMNHNLLLSDRVIADSKPNLEVFADDVKASHGATVGQLDPEEIFYLRARGFSEKEARAILIEAFCQEITQLLSS